MSADVHKYGYASKGVSVILYRDHELARKQLFVTTRLARRLLRVDGDGGDPAGRADGGGVGGDDAHRPRRATSS